MNTRLRHGRWLILALALLLAQAPPAAAEDENGVTVFTKPYYTKEQVEKAAAEIPRVRLDRPKDRWAHLARTASILAGGRELRIVMLGDSIVNDTSQSRWEDVLQRLYPRCKIVNITCVRGSTGCWWFKEPGRVKRYVLDHHPDLLIIGGISQKDDVDSIQDVIRQVRAASPSDFLLMTGAFGYVDPNDNKQWSFTFDPQGADYRARLSRLAAAEKTAFFDMTAWWGKSVRDSGRQLNWFKRDAVHANERGMQILGQLLAEFLGPPVERR